MTPLAHAMQFLKRRLLTEQELTQKLLARNYNPVDVAQVIAELKRKNLINDARLAEARARAIADRKHGRHNATRKLSDAGIDDASVVRAVEETFEPIDELSVARQLLKKKARSWSGLPEETRYRRATGLLLRKGYDNDVIRTAIRDELGIESD
jgi:regulatory protein